MDKTRYSITILRNDTLYCLLTLSQYPSIDMARRCTLLIANTSDVHVHIDDIYIYIEAF